MQRTTVSRTRATAVALLVLLPALLAGCSQKGLLQDGPLPQGEADGLARIVDLAAERVTLSDQVAAAKFGTTQPVTDPAREAAVIAGARTAAGREGVDPDWTARVFADQIAASTQVQDGLVRLWTDQPATRPAQRPQLAPVRVELDRIGAGLVDALQAAAPARAHEECPARMAQEAVLAARPMDDAHRAALGRSLASVCDGAGGG